MGNGGEIMEMGPPKEIAGIVKGLIINHWFPFLRFLDAPFCGFWNIYSHTPSVNEY